MKYKIKQSRFEELVMKYLDYTFLGIKENGINIDGENLLWWEKNGVVMINIDVEYSHYEHLAMAVHSSVWKVLRDLFNLSPQQSEAYLKIRVKKNLEYDPDEILILI